MELRKDYILDRWVILSEGRGTRPREFKSTGKTEVKTDFFAPGNEEKTPPEIGRICDGKKWKMRWFENKFPAVDMAGDYEIKTDNKYFTYASAYGKHEVVVETRSKRKQLTELPEEDIKTLLRVYANRILELSKEKGVRYVCVFKNHGKKGGTSIIHSHSQVIAYNKIPEEVEKEIAACKNYENCPYCEIVNIEKDSDRRCFENEYFVAFTPYASRFNYEIWVFPKEHIRCMTKFGEEHYKALASIMKMIFLKLKKLKADYNFFLHYSPQEEDLHFHIEICPRISTWGGFELAAGTVINSVSPEEAAKFYRE